MDRRRLSRDDVSIRMRKACVRPGSGRIGLAARLACGLFAPDAAFPCCSLKCRQQPANQQLPALQGLAQLAGAMPCLSQEAALADTEACAGMAALCMEEEQPCFCGYLMCPQQRIALSSKRAMRCSCSLPRVPSLPMKAAMQCRGVCYQCPPAHGAHDMLPAQAALVGRRPVRSLAHADCPHGVKLLCARVDKQHCKLTCTSAQWSGST